METHQLHPDTCVDAYAYYLFNQAVTRVSDSEIAKDLVQDTFIAGLKSAKNFKGDAAERTWLIAILKRKVIDHYRKINSAKGQKEVRMNFYEDGDKKGRWIEERVPQNWGNDADKDLENEELKSTLERCIQSLPEK